MGEMNWNITIRLENMLNSLLIFVVILKEIYYRMSPHVNRREDAGQ